MRLLLVMLLVSASPAIAQTCIGTLRESPFNSGSSRIYNDRGQLVGTARDNAFARGRTDLYDAQGRATGVQVRDNAFDPDRRDILDAQPSGER